MRLFVAVELDDMVRRAAGETSRRLQQQLRNTLQARWTDVDHMHLTVRFIGAVGNERVPAIVEALRAPLPITAFEVALGECGAFPPHGAPRVLWIGLSAGLPSLTAMHDECNRRLHPLGFAPESRPYNAHLTLARVKDAPRGSAVLIRDAIRGEDPSGARCAVSHATVFESRLSPRGSTYTALMNIPLS
jgi:2'-5' RNA ligase